MFSPAAELCLFLKTFLGPLSHGEVCVYEYECVSVYVGECVNMCECVSVCIYECLCLNVSGLGH